MRSILSKQQTTIVQEELVRILEHKKNLLLIVLFLLYILVVPFILISLFDRQVILEHNIRFLDLFQMFSNIYYYIYLVSLPIFLVYGLSLDTFISAKKEKAIEALLCTPISLEDLLYGKVLALLIISYGSALFSALIFTITGSIFFLGQVFLPQWPVWLYFFLILPAMLFGIICLAAIGQLIAKRFTGVNFVFFLIAFVFMFIPSFFLNRFIFFNAQLFLYFYGFLAILLLICQRVVVKKLLTKESIILS